MAWNDNNNQTPPELDEVIKDFKINSAILLVVVVLLQIILEQVSWQRAVLNTS